jgi:hypothetical protein
MSVALANIVDKEKLREVINSFEFKYGVLESIPRIYIGETEELKKELRGEIEPDNFNTGRLFSSDSEIRWRKKGKNESGAKKKKREINGMNSVYPKVGSIP